MRPASATSSSGSAPQQLVFAGVTTEVCVQTTMREANDRGYECLLAEDATESYFPEFKAAALAMIRAQGAIVGWTATTDQVLEGIRAMPNRSPLPACSTAAGASWRSSLSATASSVHWLLKGGPVEPSVASCSYQPGAGVPRHRHVGLETIVVLEGIAERRERRLSGRQRRSSTRSGPSIRCGRRTGCVVLIQWDLPVIILGEDEHER